MPPSPSRYLLYSHDTYGLGHFRRSCLLAGAIVAADPAAQVLIATGSPVAHAFPLPERVDSLKLPAVTKDASGAYRPRKLAGDLVDLVRLRASVLLAACSQFRPDVVLVDQTPIGMGGELLPLLRSVRGGDPNRPRPRLVLGLRDIVDDAARVTHDWCTDGSWDWIEAYDQVLVYGDERVETTARELHLGLRTGRDVVHVGYVAPTMPAPTAGDPYVLVTGGGGGDGHELLRRYLDAVDAGALGGIRSLVVTGPLMATRRRAELVERAERTDAVDLIEFTDDMRSLIASSIGVVSMAGYNTVVEELASGVPALLVPRTAPRLEQDIRARRLHGLSSLERCRSEAITPDRVADFVERCAADGRRVSADLDLGGAGRAAEVLRSSGPRDRSVRRRTTLERKEAAHV